MTTLEYLQILPKKTLESARHDPRTHNPQDIKAFTDGSCSQNGDKKAKAGIGYGSAQTTQETPVPQSKKNIIQTNNMAELLTIHEALKISPSNARLHIKTDSNWAINTLCM